MENPPFGNLLLLISRRSRPGKSKNSFSSGTGAGPKDVASKNVALRSPGGKGDEELSRF